MVGGDEGFIPTVERRLFCLGNRQIRTGTAIADVTKSLSATVVVMAPWNAEALDSRVTGSSRVTRQGFVLELSRVE